MFLFGVPLTFESNREAMRDAVVKVLGPRILRQKIMVRLLMHKWGPHKLALTFGCKNLSCLVKFDKNQVGPCFFS